MKLTSGCTLHIYAFGKLYKVLSVCKSVEEANEFCLHNPDGAVISESDNGLIIVAARDGVKMKY